MILAFDTSSDVSAVGLFDDEAKPLWIDVTAVEGRHGDVLLSRIAAGLTTLGATAGNISVLAVGVGPGSFTGLRIGLATAQGFAFSFDLPVYGIVSSLAIATPLLSPGGLVAVLTDAFKGEVALSVYDTDHSGRPRQRLAPTAWSPEIAANRVTSLLGDKALCVVGGGYRRYRDRVASRLPSGFSVAPPSADTPSPGVLASTAQQRLAAGERSDDHALLPYYVRDADATLPQRPLKV